MSENGDYISREAAITTYKTFGHLNLHNVIEAFNEIPAADVRPAVLCRDCKWWTKQKASLQGRCELLQMYPAGAWFCANGKREES